MSPLGQERRFGRSSPDVRFHPRKRPNLRPVKMVKTCRYQISLLSWLLHE